MTIAINTRLQQKDQPEGYATYLFELLNALTNSYPQHQFIYIFDRAYDEKLQFAKNVLPVVAGPQTNNSLRLQYWFNFKIPAVLRKHKADVFVSLEGICSMRTKKPQCLLFTDTSFLQSKPVIKKTNHRLLKKYTHAFIEKAESIAMVSNYTASTITNTYPQVNKHAPIIHPCISPIFKPLAWEEKAAVQEQHTQGKAYFLYSGAINQNSNLINLLKAFTLFKKRQKSNMLLVIAGEADAAFTNELKTYKLRQEVLVLEKLQPEELNKITAAAYALVYPVWYADFTITALQALACEVPLIVSHTGALPAIFEDAALYVEPGNINNIADQLMHIFKDEDKLQQLVNSGKSVIKQYQPNLSATALMDTILKAYNAYKETGDLP